LKKSIIIFIVLLLLTLGLPAIAAFVEPPAKNTNELATLFTAQISCPPHSHLFY